MAAPHWVERYQRPTLATRLPRKETAREHHAREIGEDGTESLAAIFAADAPRRLRTISAVETLRPMWLQLLRAARRRDALPQGGGWCIPPAVDPIAPTAQGHVQIGAA